MFMAKKQPKILHFEDEQFIAQMYQDSFERRGLCYVTYPDPTNDPVAIVKREKPDLIIMGVIMPVMDGWTASKLIRADTTTKDIPLIGFDNLSQDEDIAKAHAAGMDEYFVMAAMLPS